MERPTARVALGQALRASDRASSAIDLSERPARRHVGHVLRASRVVGARVDAYRACRARRCWPGQDPALRLHDACWPAATTTSCCSSRPRPMRTKRCRPRRGKAAWPSTEVGRIVAEPAWPCATARVLRCR
jgi:hypothetical protein